MMPRYTGPVLAWMESHAIAPDLAAEIGITDTGGVMGFPIVTRTGDRFTRTRRLPGGNCMQPKGRGLVPWWPTGHRPAEYVLIVEGEGDALAALTARSECPASSTIHRLGVVALPGAGVAHTALLEDLAAAGTRFAVLALDGDQAGRAATVKLGNRLTDTGVRCLTIELPDGFDLADLLAKSENRAERFCAAISGAQPFHRIITPKIPAKPRRSVYRASVSGGSDEIRRALDHLRSIPAAEYLPVLAGVNPLPGGMVSCPLPDHNDLQPSASYRGTVWHCHRCGEGGDLLALAAAITGDTLTGPNFYEVARWAAERLTNNAAVFERPDERRVA